MKNFVKAIDKNKAAFMNLIGKFQPPNAVKINEQTFIGPQICELINDDEFLSVTWQGKG